MKNKKDKKPKSMLPKMQYYFKKGKHQNELISLIDNRLMIKVSVMAQSIGAILSFDKKEIHAVKKGKYKKVSLKNGLDNVVNIAVLEAVFDEKITKGLENLMTELAVITVEKNSERIFKSKNCCQGG